MAVEPKERTYAEKEQQVRDVMSEEESAELVNAVEAKLEAMNEGDATPSKLEPESSELAKEDDDPQYKLAEPSEIVDDKPSDKKSDEEISLPEAYVRAAIHQGWDAKDITEFYEKDPERAVKTLGNIYQSTNRLSQQFAQFGRSAKDTATKEVKSIENKVAKPNVGLTVDQITKLEAEYKDDPIVELIKSQNQGMQAIYGELQEVKSKSVTSRQEDTSVVDAEVFSFFGSEGMKPYSDFYGTVSAGQDANVVLTPGEIANRIAVLELADAIAAGAMLQGRKMSIQDALSLAHLSVADPIKTKVVRNAIKKSVQKQSNGLSLKPKSSGVTDVTGKPATEQEIEERAAERLSSVFRK